MGSLIYYYKIGISSIKSFYFVITGLFSLSLSAYLNVFIEWSEEEDPGEIQAIITILVFLAFD